MFRAVIATFVISSGFLQVMKKRAFILGLLISELKHTLLHGSWGLQDEPA